MAYCFTNLFSVFVLSLSCGLDTLSKAQLENIWFLRYALCLVALGVIPYLLCAGWSAPILSGLNTSSEIIDSTSRCILLLTVYAVCYIVFAMLRKVIYPKFRIHTFLELILFDFVFWTVFGVLVYSKVVTPVPSHCAADRAHVCSVMHPFDDWICALFLYRIGNRLVFDRRLVVDGGIARGHCHHAQSADEAQCQVPVQFVLSRNTK